MGKVACVLAEGFEDSEFRAPVQALREHGHEVTVLGDAEGQILVGKRKLERVRVDGPLAGRGADEFDALLIPGGRSPELLRSSPAAVSLCRGFARAGRPIAAICHGPLLLIAAGLVAGRNMTSWPGVRHALETAGARWADAAVVRDGPFITSRRPADLPAFCRALLEALGEREPS